jgi:YidC/Oxa1 family membrane protein insertase
MDIIVNPFISLLTLLYSLLGYNMVLAIVVFTIIVRLLTYPLTMQQMKSSQAMQKLQPELKKLQEKYKNDREKLSQEQMKLYKEYGFNPFGGCLPLLIQFPIFIALYQAIIHVLAATPMQLLDLSGRILLPGFDQIIPLNNMFLGLNLTQPPHIGIGALETVVGILLVGGTVVTTWLQFKLTTPAPQPSEDGKPNQAQSMTQSMGTIMPLMYGFFALSFSIGISIYFIVSNIMGIVQAFASGRADVSNLKIFRRPKPVAVTAGTTSNATPGKIEGKAKPVSSGKSNTANPNSNTTPGKMEGNAKPVSSGKSNAAKTSKKTQQTDMWK